ncbi:MAG: ABC transporter ATP-binding protein [Verrucomicrobia bacterium]|nr:ABC transporter ATP-binding protein [Verrucomicrobiota bacterium]MBU4291430.1 ABC transporter ATP-binding protein [Verrucomicrobiota bacterium]MBU4430458.1 ABC transporter ATP-binding protein [Verrucomicrobiota bacterium]MCG2679575.1 ABC transporter ATP-binding protein [Kiritimatiellia bacterium]
MEPLLKVENLTVSFQADEGRLQAVDGVSFHINRGEVLGLVGESGCGKSVTAHSLVRLIPSPPGRIEAGSVRFDGRDLLALPIEELRQIRGRAISMIFQDPLTALSPLHRIGAQLAETLQLHRPIGRREAWAIGEDWLQRVGIPDPAERLFAYPHQCSGGMRQRVMIAMALMLNPDLVIADEPTTALDVTIQAQIFELMLALKRRDSSILLITHDMGVVWELCSRMIVMYASRIVEEGSVPDVFSAPLHPYTRGLLSSMPSRQQRGRRLEAIPGQVPSPMQYPRGCHFCDRCPLAFDRCRVEKPELAGLGEGRRVACFRAGTDRCK